VKSEALAAAISAIVGKKHAGLVNVNLAAVEAGRAAAEAIVGAQSERKVVHAITQ
jgi:Pyruvate/2-oxoacid:ferredoxin oxidoreductase gamma subunit